MPSVGASARCGLLQTSRPAVSALKARESPLPPRRASAAHSSTDFGRTTLGSSCGPLAAGGCPAQRYRAEAGVSLHACSPGRLQQASLGKLGAGQASPATRVRSIAGRVADMAKPPRTGDRKGGVGAGVCVGPECAHPEELGSAGFQATWVGATAAEAERPGSSHESVGRCARFGPCDLVARRQILRSRSIPGSEGSASSARVGAKRSR